MKKINKIVVIILVILSIILGYGIWYVNDYYKVENNSEVQVATKNAKINNDYIEFNHNSNSKIGIIFYPGGKVYPLAYNVMLNNLSHKNYHVFGLKVLFNLAILDENKANSVINNHKNIKKWVLIGHSLGGVTAQNFANKHKNIVNAVIHLGSYPLDSKNNVTNLAIYGSLDKVVNKTKLKNAEQIFEINGANHAQYGNYGKQKGDGQATISSQMQQEITINKIIEFMISKGVK